MSKYSRPPSRLTFVVATSAVALAACQPDYDYSNNDPRTMQRAEYSSVQECERVWKSKSECEPQQPMGQSRSVVYGPFFSGGHYYSTSGSVYSVPANIGTPHVTHTPNMTPSAVYSSSPAYASGSSSFNSSRTAAMAARTSSTGASSRGGAVTTAHASGGG